MQNKTRIFLASSCALLAFAPGANAQGPIQIFQDVPTSASYFDATRLLYDRLLTAGCSASPRNYCPDQALTRGAMAVLLIRAINSAVSGNAEQFTYSPSPYFSDVPASSPYFPYI
jgi:hypothetical protein